MCHHREFWYFLSLSGIFWVMYCYMNIPLQGIWSCSIIIGDIWKYTPLSICVFPLSRRLVIIYLCHLREMCSMKGSYLHGRWGYVVYGNLCLWRRISAVRDGYVAMEGEYVCHQRWMYAVKDGCFPWKANVWRKEFVCRNATMFAVEDKCMSWKVNVCRWGEFMP